MDYQENENVVPSVCKDCGNQFIVESGEKAFFEKKQMELPKRCKSCRDRRKREKARQESFA
jgi:hypothetical protein